MADQSKYIDAMTAWDQAKDTLDAKELEIRHLKRSIENLYDMKFLELKGAKMTIPVIEATIRQNLEYQKLQGQLMQRELECLALKKEEREKRRLYEEAKSIYLNDLRMDKSSNYTPDTRPTTYQKPI